VEPDRVASAGSVTGPPEGPGEERPRAVTVIGVAWLIFGGFRVLGGLFGLILWKLGGVQDLLTRPSVFSGLVPMRILRTVFRQFGVEVTVQMLVGVVVVFCAAGLLRLRPWARPAIETFCWLGLTFLVCFSIFWVFLWTRGIGEAASNPPSLRPLAVGITLLLTGGLALAFVAMIRVLRRPDVRAAFRRA
jgi:hypothetical protein